MDDRIASLSAEQAEQGVKELFDLLPKSLFGGEKPTLADLADLTSEAREEAPPGLQPFLRAVVDDPDPARRGELARHVLDQLSQVPELGDMVDEALRRGSQPHMSISLLIGVVVLVMTVMPKSIRFKGRKLESIECGHFQDAATLVHELTGFVEALPPDLKSLFGGGS